MRVGKRADSENHAHNYELDRSNPKLERICINNLALRTAVMLWEINNDFRRWAASTSDPEFIDMVQSVKRAMSTLKEHADQRREAMKDE